MKDKKLWIGGRSASGSILIMKIEDLQNPIKLTLTSIGTGSINKILPYGNVQD
jgi:hypothetical protein